MAPTFDTAEPIFFPEEVTEASYAYALFRGDAAATLHFSGRPAARVVSFSYPILPFSYQYPCFNITGVVRNTVLRFNHVVSTSVTSIGPYNVVFLNADLYNSSLLISNTTCFMSLLTTYSNPVIAEGSFVGLTASYANGYALLGTLDISDSVINVTDIIFSNSAMYLVGAMTNSTLFFRNVNCVDNSVLLNMEMNWTITSNKFYFENIFLSSQLAYLHSTGTTVNVKNNSFYFMNCTGAGTVLSTPRSTMLGSVNTFRGDARTTAGGVALTTPALWAAAAGTRVGAMLTGCDDLCVGGAFADCGCACASESEKGLYCVPNAYFFETYVSDEPVATIAPPILRDGAQWGRGAVGLVLLWAVCCCLLF
ncbi:hypothetical protein STCU_10253 [Strigomonas culicis]|uniref:Uncharacterized protein n=1 Tax=Strigomonas culicis TaxID=28005 RepID=S9TML8_9TRYP|nr:hypothetical protein STCU_10253 [Strigomonas culicis]|eukprot:EPY18014.1 hypothetical protein STCU_10253 [Strigomonas culicis]